MTDLTTAIFLKFVLPLAGVACGAAVVADAQSSGLQLGLQEVSLGVLALFVLQQSFAFVKWVLERRDQAAVAKRGGPIAADGSGSVGIPPELVDHMRRQTEAFEGIHEELRNLKGLCPLNGVAGHRELVEAVGREVKRQRDS